jgi:catechol 2,3-dioxygenase-like lactoylglutathione lyase family enzyme
LVREYDEAIAYFVNVLGFDLVEDRPLPAESKRWVVVGPRGGSGCRLLLARARGPEQLEQVGRQAGGRVAFFLETDDLGRDYELYRSRGVRFVEDVRQESYGSVVVFEDLYGNRWDLIEHR